MDINTDGTILLWSGHNFNDDEFTNDLILFHVIKISFFSLKVFEWTIIVLIFYRWLAHFCFHSWQWYFYFSLYRGVWTSFRISMHCFVKISQNHCRNFICRRQTAKNIQSSYSIWFWRSRSLETYRPNVVFYSDSIRLITYCRLTCEPVAICHFRIFARESYNSSKKYKLNRVYTNEIKLHENREIEVCSGKTTGYHWTANYCGGKVHPCFVSHAFSSLDKGRPPCFHVPSSFKAWLPSKWTCADWSPSLKEAWSTRITDLGAWLRTTSCCILFAEAFMLSRDMMLVFA